VNGAVGLVVAPSGRLLTALGFEVTHGKIVEIAVFADPARFNELELAVLHD
jgi:RNA polymerase sigma-70 factor (ECF subfamily)